MKYLKALLIGVVTLCSGTAKTYASTDVMGTRIASMTITNVQVSSGSACTMVSTTTYSMNGRDFMQIQNNHATAKIYCDINKARCASGSGIVIYPNGGVLSSDIPNKDPDGIQLEYYCASDTASTTGIAVTQTRRK